jgi:enoyl-[acyl-carrier protein] reductase II
MQTPLTDLLEIEFPVMLAGMGGVSYHALVGAVSEAGGFGCLGASTMRPEEIVNEIRAVRQRTPKPFGVDLLTALPAEMMTNVENLIREGASVFVAGLGVPRDAVELCHEHGVLVANMCGKVRHARTAVEAGCDFVIAQGTEAGGHTGTVATMPLVPQIVDAVGARVPVVAAGGIFDGRGLAAALALGAAGVWIGTRFIATPEARAVPGYKDALVRAAEDGTVVSRAFTGKTFARGPQRTDAALRGAPRGAAPVPAAAVHRDERRLDAPRRRRAHRRRSRPGVLPGRPGRGRDRRARARW